MWHKRSASQSTTAAAVRSTLRYAGAIATIATLGVPAEQAFSQEETPGVEEIVVTGSRIRRTDEGALPVQTITQEQIQRSGATSPEQFLQTLSVAVQGNTNAVTASGSGVTSGGVSSASLRGLGSQRTLVLMNGRRLSGGGTITDSTSVDVNSIPLAAVERVEVLKDGASAVYGSDAIAGVINFILRRDYQGAEVTANYGDTSDGGAITKINGVVGFGDLEDDRYNVMLVGSWQNEEALFGADRDFADSGINEAAQNDATSGNTFPANVVAVDGSVAGNPFAGNCAPSVTSPFFSPAVCRYDPAPFVSLLPDSERSSVYGAFRYALTDEVQAYLEASYSRNEMDFVIQPVPISDQFAAAGQSSAVQCRALQRLRDGHAAARQSVLPDAVRDFADRRRNAGSAGALSIGDHRQPRMDRHDRAAARGTGHRGRRRRLAVRCRRALVRDETRGGVQERRAFL